MEQINENQNQTITDAELENVEYSIKGILKEIQSDSIDLGYITEKLNSIKLTAERVRKHQAKVIG